MTKLVFYKAAVLLAVVGLAGCTGKGGGQVGQVPGPGAKSQKMDPYLAELFKRPDDFELVNKIFVRISETCDGGDLKELAKLPMEHRVVLDVWGSHGIIGNGGFQYLFESGLADMPGISKSYDTIGVPRAAKAFREAMALFPQSTPHKDVDERLTYLESLGPAARERLEQLSKEIWHSDREIRRKLATYVRTNQPAFAHLPPSRWEDIDEVRTRDLPAPPANADPESVIAWLESIGATARRWEDAYHDVRQTRPEPSDNPIVSLTLSPHRNSTDADLEQVAGYSALASVREVQLNESYVSGRGLAHLARFGDLRLLSLRDTDTADEDLEHLYSLPKLESLDLAKTRISNAGLLRIARLSSLNKLGLDQTAIDDDGLANLAPLDNLRSLELRWTSAKGSGLAALHELPLEDLALMGSKVTDDGLGSLRQLQALTSIDLSDTGIGDRTLEHLSHLAKLQTLGLSSTKVTDNGLAHLSGLTRLESLGLEVTAIDGRGLTHLARLPKLEDLNVFMTKCGDEAARHISQIRTLKRLWMSKTEVTDSCFGYLSQLSELEKLSLDDTPLRGGPQLRQLEALKSLTWLSLPKHLEGNAHVRYLQRQMPKTQFSF